MIREGQKKDIEEIVRLSAELHKESRYSVMEFAYDKMRSLLTDAVDNDNFLLLVVEQDGQLIGGFIGIVSPHWCCHDITSCDLALFISKERRGKSVSKLLIDMYVNWALGKGVLPSMIMLGTSTGIESDKVEGLFEACGFRKIGGLFEYNKGVS